MNILSCVIDCLDYGDQTAARDSAEIGEDVSEEAETSNEVVQVGTLETTARTTRSGRTPRPRDQSTVKYPRLLMTLMSLWLINTKDKLLFDTSCSICATGGVLSEKLSGSVRPAFQNPYPICDQHLRYSLPYL